jgi:Fe-S oxidoreductase
MVSQIVFTILVVLAFAVFAWSVQKYVRCMLLGKAEDEFDKIGSRLVDFFKYFFFQKKVAELPSKGYPVRNSLHHLPIFWGFLIITLETVEMMITGISGISHPYRYLVGATLYNVFSLIVDLTNFGVLLVVLYAFFRRVVIRPQLIPLNVDAGMILGMIAALTLTYHTMEVAKIKQVDRRAHDTKGRQMDHHGNAMPHLEDIDDMKRYKPVSFFAAGVFPTMSAKTAAHVAVINWWIHMIIILFFLNYLPYSKHIHVLGAWANIFFRRKGPKGVMPKIDLEGALEEEEEEEEDGEEALDWGVEKFDQFTWKELLDTYACTECARCTNYCPAYATDKPLSPMDLVHDIRYEMLEKGALMLKERNADTKRKKQINEQIEKLPPMVAKETGGDKTKARIDDETLWSCTTCGACREVCPVFIEHPNAILKMRTNLVLAQEQRVPQELATAFAGLERNMNPWGLGIDSRFDWAQDLDVPVFGELDDPEKVEWCFFIGCAGNYDNRMQKQSKAFIEVLKSAGVRFAVLGPQEVCCGDAARRAGHEYLYQILAEQNIETLNDFGVKKIVTACPHGYHTLKKEYPQMEKGTFEVWHSSQLLAQLIEQGQIGLKNRIEGKLTLHDSCYLGRWNDIYEAPRFVVNSVAGKGGFVELERHGAHSFCCGAGGGRFWLDEQTPRVNENRTEEIVDSGAKVVAVCCPFCTTMINDGLKALNKEEEIEVLDLVELVDRAMEKPKNGSAQGATTHKKEQTGRDPTEGKD